MTHDGDVRGASPNVTSWRFRLDGSVQRFGNVAIGGSPLRMFRLTDAGSRLLERIARGEEVPTSRLTDALVDGGAIHPTAERGRGPTRRFRRDDVTVVVPTLGPADRAPAGAIVVDDGSTPPVRGATVRLDRNQGPAAARNAGLERVTTSLVAFVDSDVDLPDDWLDLLLPHFDDERVALVAPRVLAPSGTGTLAAYERAHGALDLGGEPARVRAGSRVSYVPAAAIVCRTDAVRGIGGFDAGLRFGEDVDLVWRLDEAGWRCRYEPACVVHHDARPDWSAWWRQRVAYGSSAAPLARRHRGALAPLRMSGWSIATWAAAIAGHPVVGAAIGGGSAAALVRKLPDLPARAAFRIAALGNLHAGEQIAAAVRRAWWPMVLVAATRSRFARRALVASFVAARHPIRAADDVAYSVGLWRGVAKERTIGPLLPEIVSWPGRRR